MKGIILAAGRGSRLKSLTEDKPKCLNRVGAKTMLEWQLDMLKRCGISDILVVTGYRSESIEALGVKTIKNQRWEKTNMVQSLLCAKRFFNEDIVISYGDIVYGVNVISPLVNQAQDAALVYDRNWKALWEKRFKDPLQDAESFKIDGNSRITEIGRRVSDINEIEGQYLGLLRFSPKGLGWIDKTTSAMDKEALDKLDMTSLVRALIKTDHPVYGIGINGGWCEIDAPEDLELANDMYKKGQFKW